MGWYEHELVFAAITTLNEANKSTNASQVSSRTGLSRQRVVAAAGVLRRDGRIRDVGKGVAYNWRIIKEVKP